MLGQYAAGRSASTDNRIFVYEVAGLSENEATANIQAPIRSSQNQLMQVPFNRMNEEMRRITMLGGEIVSIRPLDAQAAPADEKSTEETASAEEETTKETAPS